MAILILFLYLLYISSATGHFSAYIVAGNNADIRYFPYQVSIQVNAATHFCGGAVITEKFIITAAHCICLDVFPISQLFISVGSTRLSDKGQTYTIENTVCHAQFNEHESKLHDIGLIGVKDRIICSDFVKPISIIKNNIPVGTILTVSGWGYTSYQNKSTPDILQMLQVRVISPKTCKIALKEQKEPIEDTQICTFLKTNRGVCHGDSGGPITLNGVLVGLVSSVADNIENPAELVCATGKPDVFTKVSKYIKWIKTAITTYCKTRNCPTKKLYPKFVRINKS